MSKQYLKEFGFTPQEAARLNRLSPTVASQELRQNIEAFVGEVLQDHPVSPLYNFYFGQEGRLYSQPTVSEEFLVESQIDPRERGGASLLGFKKLEMSLKNAQPNEVVLWYSPKGPTSYGGEIESPFEEIVYRDGQLYIQFFDGEKVKAAAVKVGDERLVFEVFKRFGRKKKAFLQERELIDYYLLNPVSTRLSIDDLLKEVDTIGLSDQTIYQDRDGTNHSLGFIINQVRQRFTGQELPSFQLYPDKTVDALLAKGKAQGWTERHIEKAYLTTILKFAQGRGLGAIELMGSCGGSEVETADIIKALADHGLSQILSSDFIEPTNFLSVFSTEYRIIDSSETRKATCPNCGGEVVFDSEKVKAEGFLACPHCGASTTCVEPIVKAAKKVL